jgi:pimeloyl-ACP methyl ester carboxylesterase
MGLLNLIVHASLALSAQLSGKGLLREIVGPKVDSIDEPLAQNFMDQVQARSVPVSTSVSPSGSVLTTFAKFEAAGSTTKKKEKTPLVLLHGFDSSCLEFRRLAPLLADEGFEVYIPDILGWGFNPPQDLNSYGPAAKIEHLTSFVKTVSKGKPVVVAGASLGGALAITLAADYPELVSKLILIDAQGFIDGEGPKDLPDAIARFSVNVLKSTPLRMVANVIAYRDWKTFATLDAMRIGRLHCMVPSWEDASVSFLLSGGFVVSDKVSRVKQDTLVLWGDGDGILAPSTAYQFTDILPRSSLVWCRSGHVPHLETPDAACSAISDWLK